MADEVVGKVHGKYHTYSIIKESGVFATKYKVKRDDGRVLSSYGSRADAFRRAHNEAGPDAYESS